MEQKHREVTTFNTVGPLFPLHTHTHTHTYIHVHISDFSPKNEDRESATSVPQTGVLFQLIVDYGTAKKNIFCPTVGVWTFFTLYLRFHFYFGRDFFYFYVGFQPIVHQPQAPPFSPSFLPFFLTTKEREK